MKGARRREECVQHARNTRMQVTWLPSKKSAARDVIASDPDSLQLNGSGGRGVSPPPHFFPFSPCQRVSQGRASAISDDLLPADHLLDVPIPDAALAALFSLSLSLSLSLFRYVSRLRVTKCLSSAIRRLLTRSSHEICPHSKRDATVRR